MAKAPNKTGNRRTVTNTTESTAPSRAVPNVRTIRAEEDKIGYRRTGDVLDHGLESPQFHYVWANKLNSVDINSRILDGYRFVRYDDVKAELSADDRTEYLYDQDVTGRVIFGNDLILMRQPRGKYESQVRAGFVEHISRMNDTGEELMQKQLDDFLSTTSLPSRVVPRVSVDEDSGTTQVVEVDPSSNQVAPTGSPLVEDNENEQEKE